MYGFRKTVSAATFTDSTAFGISLKSALVIAQVLGYLFALSGHRAHALECIFFVHQWALPWAYLGIGILFHRRSFLYRLCGTDAQHQFYF